MTPTMSTSSYCTSILTAALLLACSPKSEPTPAQPTQPSREAPPASAQPATESATAKSAPARADDGLAHSGPVTFVVNGKPADVAARPGDNDEPLASWTRMNNYLSINFYGDMPGAAKRAWLRLNLDNFEGKPGQYEIRAAYSRYREANGAGETSYHTSPDKPGFLHIETLSELPDSPLGKVWKATGKFRAEIPLKPREESDLPLVSITDGVFTDLVIQEIGKPK